MLRYYRKSQIARRALSLFAERIGWKRRFTTHTENARPPAVRCPDEFLALRQIRSTTCYRNAKEMRSDLAAGEVCLLNIKDSLQWRIKNDRTLLWQFQLHYHEFLMPLAGTLNAPGESTATDLALIENTIESWIDENSINNADSHIDAWHPYCISRRLPVWFCLMTLPELAPNLRERMSRSAHDQADFLSSNLEWGLRGNHLLENIRAITLAGCYFDTDDAKRWLEMVQNILPSQIEEQILGHGEHFERCPMYHCQILGNFLEMLIVSQNVAPRINAMIQSTAQKMFGFLAEIVHPDGEIPLLGDSCFGEAPSANCLEQLAGAANIEFPESPDQPLANPVGPYWVFRDQNDFLIFDRGPAGAESLPAHAHCDLLTLEASLDGKRWIVDSGLCNYEDDPMRWYCRSSLAHNVVCVENQNQFDIWSKFRMGYRGWPSQPNHGFEGDCCWASGTHNAYRRFGIRRISRLIAVEKKKFWYCLDRVPSITEKRLSGFIHLGCDVQISRIRNDRFLLKIGNTVGELSFFGTCQVELVEGKYCPEFGTQFKNVVIEYTFASSVTPVAGWLLWLDNRSLSQDDAGASLHVDRCANSDRIAISNVEGTIHQLNWKFVQ